MKILLMFDDRIGLIIRSSKKSHAVGIERITSRETRQFRTPGESG